MNQIKYLISKDLTTFDGECRMTEIGSELRKRCINLGALVVQSIFTKDLNSQSDKGCQWRTVDFESLPQWMRWNDYLRRGYRFPNPSFTSCFKSIFRMHTETMNIWTHLLASLYFTMILVYNFSLSEAELSLRHKLAFSPFIIGCIFCFALSATYHTLNCHSESVCLAACTCDYLGIIVCMLGTLYSTMFYIWWCRWRLTIGYSLAYTMMAFFFTCLVFRGTVSGKDGKVARSIMGGVVAFSGFLALFHDMALSGFWYIISHYPVGRAVLGAAVCLAAAFLYSTRIPERLWPGKFDIWFHSHQLFHILVVAGALIGYDAFLIMANFRAESVNVKQCNGNDTFIFA